MKSSIIIVSVELDFALTYLSRGSSFSLLFILCCAFGPPPSRVAARSVSSWCTRASIAAARSRNSGEVVETVEVNGGIMVLNFRILVNLGVLHPVLGGVPLRQLSRCLRIMWGRSKLCKLCDTQAFRNESRYIIQSSRQNLFRLFST